MDDHVGHPGVDMHGEVAARAVQDTVVAEGLEGVDVHVIKGPGPDHPSTKDNTCSLQGGRGENMIVVALQGRKAGLFAMRLRWTYSGLL